MTEKTIYKRPYVETSVFIALIKGEALGGIDRGQIAQSIFDDAAAGRWPIFTSVFTIIEVFKDRNQPALTEREERKIDDFFKHEYIKLIEVDRFTAEHARKLARMYKLRPADALHLASAIRVKADELLSWDNDFPNTSVEGVAIRRPYWFGQTKMGV